jgi:hypothetical protein
MELQIIRANEFIRLGPRGKFDLKASKAALAELAGACCKRGINQALMDLRALQPGPKPVFSPNDLAVLVNTFREMGFTHRQRLAVLYRSDPHHRARLFAFIAKLRGWSVQAFDDFEKALAWLSGAGLDRPGTEMEYTPQPKPVPVRTRASVAAAATSAVPPVIPIDSKPARGGIPSKKGTTPSQRRRQGVIRMMQTSIGLFLVVTLMAGALLVLGAGCATPQASQETRDILLASGFHVVKATTPEQQAHLKALPPGKIAVAHRDGKTWYVYPDAARGQIYVGNPAQFQSARQTMQDAKMESWQDEAVNTDGGGDDSGAWVIWVFD